MKKVEPRINRSDKLLLHSSRHFFTSDETNGHKSAILAPIKFFLMPFYYSHASDSDGIYNDHVRKMAADYTLYAMDVQVKRKVPCSSLRVK